MTDAERVPWAEQLALDNASFREQLAYLLERSPFYREKLAGLDTNVGLDQIARLPLTEKPEVKATCTPATFPVNRLPSIRLNVAPVEIRMPAQAQSLTFS